MSKQIYYITNGLMVKPFKRNFLLKISGDKEKYINAVNVVHGWKLHDLKGSVVVFEHSARQLKKNTTHMVRCFTNIFQDGLHSLPFKYGHHSQIWGKPKMQCEICKVCCQYEENQMN